MVAFFFNIHKEKWKIVLQITTKVKNFNCKQLTDFKVFFFTTHILLMFFLSFTKLNMFSGISSNDNGIYNYYMQNKITGTCNLYPNMSR